MYDHFYKMALMALLILLIAGMSFMMFFAVHKAALDYPPIVYETASLIDENMHYIDDTSSLLNQHSQDVDSILNYDINE